MKIYVIYQQYYADFENGEDDAVYMCAAYKNKRKAAKKGIALIKEEKRNHCIDKNIKNNRNPFKSSNRVDFYTSREEQTDKVTSIFIEKMKLVA